MTSGPITVEIKEGMVTVARHVYEDTRCAFTDDWPTWVAETLERIERDAASRNPRSTIKDSSRTKPCEDMRYV